MTQEISASGLDFIVDRVDVGILVTTRELEVVLWNRFMEAHSGIKRSEIIGRGLLDVFAELPGRWLAKKLDSVFLLNNFAFSSWQQRPHLFPFKQHNPITGDGGFMFQDCTFIPVKEVDGARDLVCITVFDVTEAAVAQQRLILAGKQLEELSNEDALTGVYNRRFLESQLTREFNRVVRSGGELSVLFIDLDFFKQVNDNHGHPAGDAVLVEVAARIKGAIRGSDYLARYGGEEFAAVLTDTSAHGAQFIAERIRQTIAETPFCFEGREIAITASLGYTEYRQSVARPEMLLAQSDKAVYAAKAAGRNCVVSHDATL